MRIQALIKLGIFLIGIFIGREFLLLLLNIRNLKTTVYNLKTFHLIPIYISVDFNGCFGLGNRMKQVASLYGIGKQIDRLPYVRNNSCIQKTRSKIESIFPNFSKYVHIKNPNKTDVRIRKFAKQRFYENPLNLSNETTTSYLELDVYPPHLPSYRYWKAYKKDILDLFSFSDELVEKSQKASEKLRLDETHVLCAYTRRGDFIRHQTLKESTKKFVEAAIIYVTNFLKARFLQDITLVLMGVDTKFINELKINKTDFSAIHKWKPMSMGEDLSFAVENCNSFIHTASASSFGWWMAFLKKRNGLVFYNSQQKKNIQHVNKNDDFDIFPPDWLMLTLNKKNGTIYQEIRQLN